MSKIKKENIQEITKQSSLYPKEWLQFPDAPQTLYAIGNVELLRQRKFTVIGSRRTPSSALKLGAEIAKTLTAHFVVATGSADGGDMAAIAGGMASGKIICLLAGGFSAITQSALSVLEDVANRGLLLSPHEYDTPVRNFSFEYRNKLLAALGEGWVAEETWAIALYCAVRYINSPEQAIIASVNHDGDSDSTGSVTGNIIGAIYGYNYIKERNLLCPDGCKIEQTLELANIILTIADDLTTSCIINEYDYHDTPEKQQWFDRYCEHLPAGV